MAREIEVQAQVESYQKLERKKKVLDSFLLNILYYNVVSKGKMDKAKKRSSALLIPRCSSYWKGILRVALDYGRLIHTRFRTFRKYENL